MTMEQAGVIFGLVANIGLVLSLIFSYMKSKKHSAEQMARMELKVDELWEYHQNNHMNVGTDVAPPKKRRGRPPKE